MAAEDNRRRTTAQLQSAHLRFWPSKLQEPF
jgi:hypothetical protein